MKRARANKFNKLRLVRDRLFINDSEYLPPENIEEQETGNRSEYRARKSDKQSRWDHNRSNYNAQPARDPGQQSLNGRSRVFTRSNMRQQYNTPQQQRLDFTLPPSSNRPDMPLNKDRTESRKTKASSPIDSDQTFKKQRDQQQSDSETTPKTQDFEMIELSSTEQPDIQGRENYIPHPICLTTQ